MYVRCEIDSESTRSYLQKERGFQYDESTEKESEYYKENFYQLVIGYSYGNVFTLHGT